jgi:hypothetical protein
MNCPTNLLPENLPRDLVQAMAVCITIQAFGNDPIHVQSIFDGLYGVGPNIGMNTVGEFTALMERMHSRGLITMPSKTGTVILTDTGDEAATTFRNLWEGAGVLDLSDLC